eukprot:gnl/TRDRNA2_/TRDRNA2_82858_c1_seq1.p1 gnl/TRDRNA2_/TRDRNA2_82858_c1~~gnl/TRDRNA2_/TRDRNA2_82858_c1_seq1.p1  ORF type:complete len:142 (-),score=27.42 gnl/TRDRNA2_/TRDRNA2_82858_c1_seq1:113-538(-)
MCRILELKNILPNTDVSKLIVRCPRLLLAETNLSAVRAELETVSACTEGVPQEQLEELMVTAPQVFLLGKNEWGLSQELLRGSDWLGGANLVCKYCEYCKGLGCKSDREAVQEMIRVVRLHLRKHRLELQGLRPAIPDGSW